MCLRRLMTGANQLARQRRCGFTITELFVVLAVCALLVGLLSPAVLWSWEAARRAQCRSRLKQLGQAVHSLEGQQASLPANDQSLIDLDDPLATEMSFSVWYHVLPHLDQAVLHQTVVLEQVHPRRWQEPPGLGPNRESGKAALSIFRCPSDSATQGDCHYRTCFGSAHVASHVPAIRDQTIGVFGASTRSPKHRARWASVTDGLSCTAMISERIIGDHDRNAFDPRRDVLGIDVSRAPATADEFARICASAQILSLPPAHASFAGYTWLYGGKAFTWYDHVLPPNAVTSDCTAGVDVGSFSIAAVTARSQHAGGVMVCFGDGSVRWINNQIDQSVWRAMGTQAGSEPSTQ